MRHRSFGDFVDKKKRESIRQLGLVKKMLEHSGLKVDNFLESEDVSEPYVFCHNPSRNGSFDGVRIYKIGGELAFRIQKESKTHPYGSAYPLPIESMFNDFLSDDGMDESKAGKKIIEAVNKEIKQFFEKSVEAEKEVRKTEIESDTATVQLGSGVRDFSSLVYNKA